MKSTKRTLLFLLSALVIGMTSEAVSIPISTPDDSDTTPQHIVSFVKEKHDPAWYTRQAALWRAVTEREPTNEEAWFNLYHATRYQITFSDEQEDYTPLTAIWRAMHKALPDTYIDYLLTYFHAKFVGLPEPEFTKDEATINRCLQNMVKAIRMRPDAVDVYPEYVACLLMTGDDTLMGDILQRWYNSGTYSANLLNYAYNEMVGLEPRAVIFTHGDVDTYSKLILQYGKGLFTDAKVVCTPLLYSSPYRQTICRQLDIPAIDEPSTTSQQAYDAWLEQAELHIIRHTQRPAYFSATSDALPSFSDKLYSEGLVNRYSTRRYDNLAVKQRNYENRYLLDYLYETFVPETYEASAYRLNLNYIPCFKSLLSWYKENDKIRYRELYSMMMTILRRTENVDTDKRQSYYDEINR